MNTGHYGRGKATCTLCRCDEDVCWKHVRFVFSPHKTACPFCDPTVLHGVFLRIQRKSEQRHRHRERPLSEWWIVAHEDIQMTVLTPTTCHNLARRAQSCWQWGMGCQSTVYIHRLLCNLLKALNQSPIMHTWNKDVAPTVTCFLVFVSWCFF